MDEHSRVMAEVRRQNEEYHEEQRRGMKEFRVTFGWHQPHGPGVGDAHGHYSTIWAPTSQTASRMANARYGDRYSRVYSPEEWANWGPSMEGCKELEAMQFFSMGIIHPWPEDGIRHRGALLGS